MRNSTFLLVLLLLGGFISARAQDVQVGGTVTSSEDGSPVPGVYVILKGTQTGATTDVNGKYTITVPANSTLVFSSVGMKRQEIAVTGNAVIDVVLEPDITGLQEVIVVGYTTVRREANTGSVGLVKSDKLKDVPENSVDKLLSGKVAGMSISSSSGQPGASSQIRVRGITSLTTSNEPLWVIDGIPVFQGDLSYFTNTSNALTSLNPNDVESITVLKDASAASIYGSRGANGVILVTTKSGKQGKSRVDFRASFGFSKLANDNDYGVMTSGELLTYMRDAVYNVGLDPEDPNSGRYYVPMMLSSQPTYDWMNIVTRPGKQQNYELVLSGGNEKTTHYISASFTDDNGVFYGINFTTYQLRANIDHKVNNWLTGGVRLNGSYNKSNDVPMQSLYYANPLFAGQIIEPWTPPYNSDGSFNLQIPENGYTNPRANAAYDDQWEKQNHVNSAFYLEIKPLKGLTIKSNNSYEYLNGEGRRYWSEKSDGSSANPIATLQTSNTKYSTVVTSNTLVYDFKLGENNHFNFLAGQEASKSYNNAYYLYSPDVNPEIPYPTTSVSTSDDGDYGEGSNSLLSFFAIANYDFSNKYFLKAHWRSDGSSKFGSDRKWGTFYSIGGSWVISNEEFLKSVSFVNMLKLRATYGINGNNSIGDFQSWALYGPVQYNGATGMAPSNLGNNELRWELNKELNFGVDFGFLSRVTGQIDIYQRNTVDQLLNKPLSRTTGFASQVYNEGEVRNRGIEFIINTNILSGELTWDLGLNVSHNESRIMSLPEGETQFIDGNIIHKVGEKALEFYLFDYAGVNPVNGEALWYDEQGHISNRYSDARKIIAGSPEPTFTGGVNSTLAWKGISLNIGLEFRTGNKILIDENRYLNSDGYLWGANQARTALDYWKKPGDITRNPIPLADNPTSSSGFSSTRWMQNGDYLRIKDLTLSYMIPQKILDKARMQQVRIYTSAVNLYTFHHVDFWDPERGPLGSGYGIYPQTKKIIFGIEISL
jgi:TonB-dependent starch-binding outer membrane protein SusC